MCSSDIYPFTVTSDEILPEYLALILASRWFARCTVEFHERAGMPKINREQLATINVVVPSPDRLNGPRLHAIARIVFSSRPLKSAQPMPANEFSKPSTASGRIDDAQAHQDWHFRQRSLAVDLKVYDALKDLKWAAGDTLLYQPSYALTEEEQREFPGSKSIKPDFVLQDLQGFALAVIENKLDDPQKALPKLRLKYSLLLKPRFLYACAADGSDGLKILFFDLMWRGPDAAEFKPANTFMPLEEMKLKIEQGRQKQREQVIKIDTTLAGGFDPAAGKERYYQLDCIRILLDLFREGKMKMLVHMATGLGKTRTMVAFAKALLDYALAKRILFVVDRRTLARQAINKGFKFLSPTYNSHWITSASWRAQKNKNIHAVVIDTLEMLYDKIPSNFYDLLIVDECHRSITTNRNLIFDHFVCPRIGLTATPKIAVPDRRQRN